MRPGTAWRRRSRTPTSREVFDRPLAAFQLTQAKLADMTLELQKGFLLALHLGRLKDDHRLEPRQVSLGKLNNVREALAIARECRTILGASGITSEYPVMRHANNLESVLTYEGTSEVHQLVIGQALTGESCLLLTDRATVAVVTPRASAIARRRVQEHLARHAFRLATATNEPG